MMDIKLEYTCGDIDTKYHDNRYCLTKHFYFLDSICDFAKEQSKKLHCDVIVFIKYYSSFENEKKSDYFVWDLFSDGKSKFKNKEV